MTSADSLSQAGHEDMLPGFRFIFVTVILSASVLIFGLGAAALLRVSHEEFATLPAWRSAQSQFPPVPVETAPPTLAMLRIETPDPAKPEVNGESSDQTTAPRDPEVKAQITPETPDSVAEASPQPESSTAPAEKSADIGGQPAPAPSDTPAPIAVAVVPAPAIGKKDNGGTGSTGSGPKTSEAAAPEAQADQTKATETKPDIVKAADTKVAAIMASESKALESKALETKAPENKSLEAEVDIGVTAAITAATNGHEIKLRMIKVRTTKAKPVAKKKSRSGIYAMAQRRRAAARARAIAHARAIRLAQQKVVAPDPLAAIFGVSTQPAQVTQQQPQQQ